MTAPVSRAITWRSAGKRVAQRQSKEFRSRVRNQDLEARSGPLLRARLGQRRARVLRWPAGSGRSHSVVLEARDAVGRAARRSHWPMADRARGGTMAEGLSTTAGPCATWPQAFLSDALGLNAFSPHPQRAITASMPLRRFMASTSDCFRHRLITSRLGGTTSCHGDATRPRDWHGHQHTHLHHDLEGCSDTHG